MGKEIFYYIAIKKNEKEAIVTRCRSTVARYLGVTSMTLYRRLRYSSYTFSKDYIVMKNVQIVKSRRKGNFGEETNEQ